MLSFGYQSSVNDAAQKAGVAKAENEPRPKKLLERVRDTLRLKPYSLRTEQSYVDWIKRYIFFHKKQHPKDLGASEVRAFLEHLAADLNVSAATQNQALNSLVFLYKQVLEIDLGDLGAFLRAKRSRRLPVVLSKGEVERLLAALNGTYQLMARLMYGTGMRLMDCVRLRVKDVDFERGQIFVREGKGNKDRVTMLPERVRADLQNHLQRVAEVVGKWVWLEVSPSRKPMLAKLLAEMQARLAAWQREQGDPLAQ